MAAGGEAGQGASVGTAAQLPGCATAKLRDCQATRLPSYATARLRDCQAAKIRVFQNSK